MSMQSDLAYDHGRSWVSPQSLAVSEDHWSVLAIMRFILAMIVVNGHFFMMIFPKVTSHPASDLAIALSPGVSVLSFLVISGFSIAHSIVSSSSGFYGRRIGRIWPTLVFACLLQFFVTRLNNIILYGVFPSPMPDWNAPYDGFGDEVLCAANLLGINGFVVPAFLITTWSLSVEASYYVIAPILRRAPSMLIMAAVCLSAAAYWRHDLVSGNEIYPRVTHGVAALSLFWAWGAGFLAYRHPAWGGALPLVFGAALITHWNDQGGIYWAVTWVTACSAVAFGGSITLSEKVRACFNYLGDLSYPLFLTHFPVMLFVSFGLLYPSWSVLMIAVLFVSVITLHLIDKPLRNRIGKSVFFRRDLERFAPYIMIAIICLCVVCARYTS